MLARNELLAKKNLDPNMFKDCIPLSAPISEHAAWLFKHIYSKPYLKSDEPTRSYHGLAHISRASIYVPVFANLYRKYQDKQALQLTNEDVKLLQIAALFHDSAREDTWTDKWDDESGLMLYYYLTNLGIDEKKATLLAEAIANKDIPPDGYHHLNIGQQPPRWVVGEKSAEKNIYQKVIHDADCLDIIRVRPHFDARYLDFYKDIACKEMGNSFNEMAKLITEARCLISAMGDTDAQIKLKNDMEIKAHYENENGFSYILEHMSHQNEDYFLLNRLFRNGLLTIEQLDAINLSNNEYDANKGLDEENVQAAMNEGKLFARGTVIPSGVSLGKPRTLNSESTQLGSGATPWSIKETAVEIELRKMQRRQGIPTSSSKPNRDQKQGNPNRSICMIGNGATVFSAAGYLIINPKLDSITSVSINNASTGRNKKSTFKPSLQVSQEKENALRALLHQVKMGGSSQELGRYPIPLTNNKVTYNIEHMDAIYYCNDPIIGNYIDTANLKAPHQYAPLLQAVYLQNEYEKLCGKKLPIFEYSSVHNFIRKVEDPTPEQLIEKWRKMCADYMANQLKSANGILDFAKDSIDEIKVKALYGIFKRQADEPAPTKVYPCDVDYSKRDQEVISNLIAAERNKIIDSIKQFPPQEQILYYIAKGDIDSFKSKWELLSKDVLNKNVMSALMQVAVGCQQNRILDYLLDLDTQFLSVESDDQGKTPLHYAAIYNNLEAVRTLLSRGADINVQDKSGRTPLHYAVQYNNLCVLEGLVKMGANRTITNVQNYNPIVCAISDSSTPIVNALIDETNVNMSCDEYWGTPLWTAAQSAKIEIMRALITKGANVNIVIRGLPLLLAVLYKIADRSYTDTEILELLIESKVDINVLYDDVLSDIKSQLKSSLKDEDIKLFLAPFYPENKIPQNVLDHFFAPSRVRLLPEHKFIKLSPLCFAIMNKFVDVIEILLKNNVVIDDNAFNLAMLMKDKKIQELLISHAPDKLNEYNQRTRKELLDMEIELPEQNNKKNDFGVGDLSALLHLSLLSNTSNLKRKAEEEVPRTMQNNNF